MNKTGAYIVSGIMSFLIIGAVSSAKGEGAVDFDGISSGDKVSCDLGKSVDFELSPEPVPAVQAANGESRLYRAVLDGVSKDKIARNAGIGIKEKSLLLNNKSVIFVDNDTILVAELAGKERYNIVLSINAPALTRSVKNRAVSLGRQDKGWVQTCITVARWAIFIKDGIETGKWVYDLVCEMKWEADGPAEAGHIPFGTEGQVRTYAAQK